MANNRNQEKLKNSAKITKKAAKAVGASKIRTYGSYCFTIIKSQANRLGVPHHPGEMPSDIESQLEVVG